MNFRFQMTDIFIEKLKNGKLANVLPELYELKNIIENNLWHNNDSVFNHTIAVLEKLEMLFKKTNNNVNSYLNQMVDKNTKKQLLFLGTILHDIAKKETIINKNGLTTCSNHEQKGAVKAQKILRRFNLSQKEIYYITNLIKHHSLIHRLLDDINNQNFQAQFNNFMKKFLKNIYPELMLLGFADTAVSYLKITNPKEFQLRIKFYQRKLNKIVL
ncbi:HD domain-containing protein [Candidatus Wolfebacteria bacterium]|nr:HD domain-containing protein [Candidatus Wolfebacteria bacterium]